MSHLAGTMTEPSVSFAGNLTDDPELRHTETGIARAMFRVAVCGWRKHDGNSTPISGRRPLSRPAPTWC